MNFARQAGVLGAASSMMLTLVLSSSCDAQGMARGTGGNGNFMARGGTGGGTLNNGNYTARGNGGPSWIGDTATSPQPRATSQPRATGNNNPVWGGFSPSFTPQPSGNQGSNPPPRRRNDNYYNDSRPRTSSSYREPTYSNSKPKTSAPVKTKSNVAPKEERKQTFANAPHGGTTNSLTKEEYDAAQDAVQQQTDAARALLQGDIGTAVTDPTVAALLAEADEATKAGGSLPPDWKQRYEQAIANSGVQTGPNFQQNLDSFVGLAGANSMLAQDFSTDIPAYPSGMCNCIMMPCLPADEVCMVRPGCCMVGTGGEGIIGVVSCDASELVDMPLGVGESTSETSINYADGARSGVLIINPAENDAEINFVLDNSSHDVAAGFSRNFTGKDSWVIRFNRGSSKKDARYVIEPGTYVFVPGDNGWELFRRKIKVSVQNNGQDEFNYLVDNEHAKAEPGETLTHTSAYPIFIRFDCGISLDSETSLDSEKRIVDSNLKLAVAVDPQSGGWDLFPADNVQKSAFANAGPKSGDGKQSRTALFKSIAGNGAEGANGSRSARLLALMRNGSTPVPPPPVKEVNEVTFE